MGYTKPYRIEWYNGLTGEWLALIHEGSTTFGNLELDYPDTLTGDSTCPILFFKVYPADDTFLTPLESGGAVTALPESFSPDHEISDIEKTDWLIGFQDQTETDKFQILVSPNPVTNKVKLTIVGQIPLGENWNLTNSNGKTMLANEINTDILTIDLSNYPSGVYYFVIQTENDKSTTKIIKQ